MVYLYLCEFCQRGDHKNCELGHPAPPGVYGGSRCRCGCRGDEHWNKPEIIHKELMKQVDEIMNLTKNKNN